MSIFPPALCGGMVLCDPGSAGATPIVPQNGLSGTRAPGPYTAGAAKLFSYVQIFSAGCVNSSASSPNPGTMAVQAQPDGSKLRSVTFSARPGTPPSTYRGPAI